MQENGLPKNKNKAILYSVIFLHCFSFWHSILTNESATCQKYKYTFMAFHNVKNYGITMNSQAGLDLLVAVSSVVLVTLDSWIWTNISS